MNSNRKKRTIPPAFTAGRLFKNIWRQSKNTLDCPKNLRLDGKLALVTGGNNGIGLETSIGLAERGADVVILARNEAKAEKAIQKIKMLTGKEVKFIQIDLSNLDSVFTAVESIKKEWPNRKIDLLVTNAGIVARDFSQSAQGYEITFAVNVLGHHALVRKLYDNSKLATKARVIMVTGDIYFLAKDCTVDFKYDAKGAQKAYCRSKLGVLWCAQEWAKRYKDIDIYAVHPGVVASGLGGEVGGFADKIRHKMLLSTEKGAQTSLICATQNNLVSGAYYHNTMGEMILRKDDPVLDNSKSIAFWETLEDIVTKHSK